MAKLIAHRGLNNTLYKENTKSAILNSLREDYIGGIEIDVRITKDNKIVVTHDMTINRVSDGSGVVTNMTLKELRKYNFGTRERRSTISTLKEILDNINNNKIILIEIKYEGTNEDDYIKYFYKNIKKYLFLNIYIMSFNYQIIKKLKEKYPYLKCGLLISTIINRRHINEPFDFIAITSYSIDIVKNKKKPLFVWALKSKKKYWEIEKKNMENIYYIVDLPYKFI